MVRSVVAPRYNPVRRRVRRGRHRSKLVCVTEKREKPKTHSTEDILSAHCATTRYFLIRTTIGNTSSEQGWHFGQRDHAAAKIARMLAQLADQALVGGDERNGEIGGDGQVDAVIGGVAESDR
jgi:hypothetical protein